MNNLPLPIATADDWRAHMAHREAMPTYTGAPQDEVIGTRLARLYIKRKNEQGGRPFTAPENIHYWIDTAMGQGYLCIGTPDDAADDEDVRLNAATAIRIIDCLYLPDNDLMGDWSCYVTRDEFAYLRHCMDPSRPTGVAGRIKQFGTVVIPVPPHDEFVKNMIQACDRVVLTGMTHLLHYVVKKICEPAKGEVDAGNALDQATVERIADNMHILPYPIWGQDPLLFAPSHILSQYVHKSQAGDTPSINLRKADACVLSIPHYRGSEADVALAMIKRLKDIGLGFPVMIGLVGKGRELSMHRGDLGMGLFVPVDGKLGRTTLIERANGTIRMTFLNGRDDVVKILSGTMTYRDLQTLPDAGAMLLAAGHIVGESHGQTLRGRRPRP